MNLIKCAENGQIQIIHFLGAVLKPALNKGYNTTLELLVILVTPILAKQSNNL